LLVVLGAFWEDNMKIRDGFVTNSSSTNFLIISKKELTEDYLAKKLGLKKESLIHESAMNLVHTIMNNAHRGKKYFEIDKIDKEFVENNFGKESAQKFEELSKKGYHSYVGYTSSDDDYLTSFFTMDFFELKDKDFYIDGKNCIW